MKLFVHADTSEDIMLITLLLFFWSFKIFKIPLLVSFLTLSFFMSDIVFQEGILVMKSTEPIFSFSCLLNHVLIWILLMLPFQLCHEILSNEFVI